MTCFTHERNCEFEHYRIKFKETPHYIYYINSLGYFEIFDKRTKGQRVYERGIEKCQGYIHATHQAYYTKIQGKEYVVKREVIKHFKPEIDLENLSVRCIDNNPKNCNIENLMVIPKSQIKKKPRQVYKLSNGRSIKVYNTMQEIADDLFMSVKGVQYHLSHKQKKNRYKRYLDQFDIEIIKQ